MDSRNLQLARALVDTRYLDAAQEALQRHQTILRRLLAQRQCPETGLPDCVIESLLHSMAQMDSNNFDFHIGAGEREGRVISGLVRRRHFHLSHGIGRSGDLTVDQPKAAGSSLMSKLTNILACDVIRQSGARSTEMAFVVPMATGMTLALVLRAAAQLREQEETRRNCCCSGGSNGYGSSSNTLRRAESGVEGVNKDSNTGCDSNHSASSSDNAHMSGSVNGSGAACVSSTADCTGNDVDGDDCAPTAALVQPRYVIWTRIDQKSALKCITAAGLIPCPVELRHAARLSQRGRSLRRCATTERTRTHVGEAQSRCAHVPSVDARSGDGTAQDTAPGAPHKAAHTRRSQRTRCADNSTGDETSERINYAVRDESASPRTRSRADDVGQKESASRPHQNVTTVSSNINDDDNNISNNCALAGMNSAQSHAETSSAKVRTGQPLEGCHPYLLQAHVNDIERAIDAVGGAAAVVCVLSTTSCFAPRLPDDVCATARLCARRGVGHVINNAYGMQSTVIMQRIHAAQQLGRVDFVVQSSDKNFLVPVGGAVVSTPCAAKGRAASALYAGRASATPSLDVFITALSLGRCGFRDLWSARYVRLGSLMSALRAFARARRERVVEEDCAYSGEVQHRTTNDSMSNLGVDHDNSDSSSVSVKGGNDCSSSCVNDSCTDSSCSNVAHGHSSCVRVGQSSRPLMRNDISIAITMHSFDGMPHRAKEIGARLFRRGVTGPRVIVPDAIAGEKRCTTHVAGCAFGSYGTHTNTPVCAMLVLACGLGMTAEDEEGLLRRLNEVWPIGTPI